MHVNPESEANFMITTLRLRLVPATVALARAEIRDRDAFSQLLQAMVPDDWPPESARDALPLLLSCLEEEPDQTGWFGWYAIALDLDGASVLVGGGGFMGPPADGVIRIGYSVLHQFQGQGYATEIASGLVRWALAQPGVVRIVAETEWENPASTRVLEKCGFQRVGPVAEHGGAQFECTKLGRQRT